MEIAGNFDWLQRYRPAGTVDMPVSFFTFGVSLVGDVEIGDQFR